MPVRLVALPRALIYAVTSSLLATSVAFAHGDHGGGGGTVLPAGVTVVTAEIDYTSFRPIPDARLSDLSAQGVGEVHSLREIAVPSISIGYGVTNDITLGLRLPYLANREIRETDPDNGGVDARGGVYGFGDATVTATIRFLRDGSAGFDAAIIAGVKLPTGRNDARDKSGVLFETEHQPGSGAFDGLLGVAVAKRFGPFGLSANALYAFAGDGDQDTNLGDRFSYGVAVSVRVWSGAGFGGAQPMRLGPKRPAGIMHHGGHDHAAPVAVAFADGASSLDLTLGLNGDWLDRQTVAGVRDDNTGGHVLYVSPGLRFATGGTTTGVTFGIPIATHLNGIQSDPDWRVTSSFGVRF